ncbi:hypothetical protein L1987_78740 [Smallanthus sonchifolius]|uniref:Uncharacterized protein n=1 Tax=Smallanthus sonchifolius TaxID=185202 RepID=A0ACB8ZHZ3_9ASTR|nr:hypothetical protein L1987_78740 [Smallanthus sonchifolius]
MSVGVNCLCLDEREIKFKYIEYSLLVLIKSALRKETLERIYTLYIDLELFHVKTRSGSAALSHSLILRRERERE